METAVQGPTPQRPQHRRNASSKSNLFKALVSPKTRQDDGPDSTTGPSRQNVRTQTVPLLPPDHPHASKGKVLSERHSNARSPPSSPSKSRQKSMATSKTSHDLRTSQSPTKKSRQDGPASPKKSRSSTNLAGVFAKMNRSNKDLSSQSQPKDKENTTPPSSANGEPPAETPIWAQYASTAKKPDSRPGTRDGINSSVRVQDEIAKYTPKEYSPSKQRNFNGDFQQPQLRPTLGSRGPRPQSEYVLGADIMGAIGRRLSGDRSSSDFGRRKSEDVERSENGQRESRDKTTNRKTSGSSTEQAPAKEKLNIAKRGGRVMAAVAAFQGKSKDPQNSKREEPALDEKAVDQAFEAVLSSRNVPEPMRQKMRSLTLRVKADFVKQDQEASKTNRSSPIATENGIEVKDYASSKKAADSSPTEQKKDEEDLKSTKRSRARSRTFTFSKGDKRTDGSPSKKQRSRSKSRAATSHEVENRSPTTPTTPTTPRSSMDKRQSGTPAVPADYISYLKKNQDPVKIEVGRLHKLRILLRNETVSWVDAFLSLGGMSEIVGLLHRIMAVEWREEHEDQLLHETLLCLKGLCTTERAMSELEKVADALFPALVAMIFDEEKKGPAEYTTRGIITTVLCESELPRELLGVGSLLTTCSQLLSCGQQHFSRSIGTARSKGPNVPRRADQTRRRTPCGLRTRHARISTIQTLVPRSYERNQRSLLDLPPPPKRSTSSPTLIIKIHRLNRHLHRPSRTRESVRSNIQPPPLPRHPPPCSRSPLHRRRRMGRNNLHNHPPRPPKRSHCLHPHSFRQEQPP